MKYLKKYKESLFPSGSDFGREKIETERKRAIIY